MIIVAVGGQVTCRTLAPGRRVTGSVAGHGDGGVVPGDSGYGDPLGKVRTVLMSSGLRV